MRTSTPRFHVVDLKYARKHYETYGVSSATNEKKNKIRTGRCLFLNY